MVYIIDENCYVKDENNLVIHDVNKKIYIDLSKVKSHEYKYDEDKSNPTLNLILTFQNGVELEIGIGFINDDNKLARYSDIYPFIYEYKNYNHIEVTEFNKKTIKKIEEYLKSKEKKEEEEQWESQGYPF